MEAANPEQGQSAASASAARRPRLASTLPDRHYAVAIALMATLVTAGRATSAFTLDLPLESDGLAYFEMAKSASLGGPIVDNLGNRAHYNAGYPLFLSSLFFIAGPTREIAWLANALLGGISLVLIAQLGAAIAGKWCGLISGIVWTLYPEHYVNAASLSKENLAIALLLAQLLVLTRIRRQACKSRHAALLGLLTGFNALVASSTLALIPVLAYGVYASAGPGRERRTVFTAWVLAIGLSVLPWMTRNYIVIGAPVLNTNGGFNLYLGNNPQATGAFISITETPLGSRWREIREHGEVATERICRDEAIRFILENPWRTVELAVAKLVLFWMPPLHKGRQIVNRHEAFVRSLWAVSYIAIVGLAMTSLLVRKAHSVRHGLWMLYGSVALYVALHTLFYVIFRYRLVIMPLLIVLGSFTLATALPVLLARGSGLLHRRQG